MRDSLASLAASFGGDVEALAVGRLLLLLVLGGGLALFVRLLYLRFSRSQSNPESFSAGFAPLTVATVPVISVVNSSLAPSLGLVGALSIVRFRAAIKDPEELIYVFFCIALGPALGADQLLAAPAGLLVFTRFAPRPGLAASRSSPCSGRRPTTPRAGCARSSGSSCRARTSTRSTPFSR